jgi:hypothetical protein
MQAISTQHEPSAAVLGIPGFGQMLYATDPGLDHPTPPAPDRGKSGSKPKPKPAAKTNKKKKKK